MNRYMVVKHPCCGAFLGWTVESAEEPIAQGAIGMYCGKCGHPHFITPDKLPIVAVKRSEHWSAWPLPWMVRLPDLHEDVETKEAVEA